MSGDVSNITNGHAPKEATENIGNPGQQIEFSWRQTFTFDRYGNRRFDFTNGNTTMPLSSCTEAICNPTISMSNNRLTSTGWSYDSSGNTTGDPEGRSFVYDGENKQVKVLDSQQAPIGEYSYDGDGKRVKKYVPDTGETTVFVYDAAGKPVAEYSTIVANSTDAKVAYLTNDHLGSPRINTDQNGAVISRHDYHPFGEEIGGVGGRSVGLNYGDDRVRKQFTGHERDIETELDFAQARYFGFSFGRFTTPDPIAGECAVPQSLNKYSYAWNNPLTITDPTGLIVSWEDSEKKKKKGETEERTNAQRAYEKRLDDMVNSKDKKTHDKGVRLNAEYERLQKSDITFHVVKENPSGASSGELTYAGQQGHLYVNLKGNANESGAIPLIQKLAHEFHHGIEFLDGDIGFQQLPNGKWTGYRDDNIDVYLRRSEPDPIGNRSDLGIDHLETDLRL